MKQINLKTAAKNDPHQIDLVLAYVQDGRWHTIPQIAEHIRCPEASVSARLRDLRKAKYGGYTVNRKYVAQGLFAYQVVPPTSAEKLSA